MFIEDGYSISKKDELYYACKTRISKLEFHSERLFWLANQYLSTGKEILVEVAGKSE